jgi:hypothetical protein
MRDDGHVPTSTRTEPDDNDNTEPSDEALAKLLEMLVQVPMRGVSV